MRWMKNLLTLFVPISALAMPVKTTMMKPRAFFVEAENNLLEPLDLKSKSLTFGKTEFDQCGSAMNRKGQSLSYSCTLTIPSQAKISKIQNLVTASKIPVTFGGTKREVQVQVSPDARSVTFSTSFDQTGIDFELSKFNDDFFSIYSRVAQLVISDALSRQAVRIEVLESR
jgi:hypothetical protein